MSKKVRRIAGFALMFGLALALPASLEAQALPTPRDFVSNFDLRCYRLNDQPPLNVALQLDHLNPYFIQKGLPFENVILGKPRELCVPVYKNNVQPTATSLPFLRFADLKCYDIAGPSLDLDIHLDHLNPQVWPVLGPSIDGVVREPQQLCVPVRKNNQAIPAAVLQLIQWLDIKCYRFEPKVFPVGQIQLHHLNPLYAAIAPQMVQVLTAPQPQLCVPVMKNLQKPVPDAVLNIVQYADVLCQPVQGAAINQGVVLNHLNPVLRQMGLPAENVVVGGTSELCVPVAKNGFFPPG